MARKYTRKAIAPSRNWRVIAQDGEALDVQGDEFQINEGTLIIIKDDMWVLAIAEGHWRSVEFLEPPPEPEEQ